MKKIAESKKGIVIDYFKQICKIPRESGNEEGMRLFLLNWAKEHKLKAQKDTCGNIIIKKEATAGMENLPALVLQGHMDMVCVKTENSKHNFLTDPIKTIEKNGFLYAEETSLGADNGIAVAIIMALFTDPTVQHGPLEAILTFSEETGMDGAFNLDAALIKSRRMINLDSEEEGVFCIGCAGGIDIYAKYKAETVKVPDNWDAVYLSVDGLKGGHSGMEIHKQRANAIQVLARLLCNLPVPFMLGSFNGGKRMNVIPSAAEAIICLPGDRKKEAVHYMNSIFEEIKNSVAIEEPDIRFSHFCSHCAKHHEKAFQIPEKGFSVNDSQKVVTALFCTPHGVHSFDYSINNSKSLVQTSDNFALVNFSVNDKNEPNIQINIRSLSEFDKENMALKIVNILKGFGFDVETGNGYPSWTPNPQSSLGKICAKAWKEVTGKEAVLTSIHAGLECGIINSKIPEMDSISLGPDIFDVHSVNEHVDLASVKRIYLFLKHLLKTQQ